MNFFKQILAEFKNMLSSKFILISGIALFLILCVAVPVLVMVNQNKYNNNDYYYRNEYTIIVDGVEIPCSNDFCWEYDNLQNQQEWILQDISDEETLKYAGDFTDYLLAYNGKYALVTMGEQDYRTQMSYQMSNRVKENYILSLENPNETKLAKAVEAVIYDVGMLSVLELTKEEQLAKIDENNEILEMYDKLMMNNDFAYYGDLQKNSYDQDIKNFNEQIVLLEKSLIENPSQEEYVAKQIEDIKVRIDNINNIYLPILDYRLEKKIIPNDGSWQDQALSEKESALSRIISIKNNTVSESEFKETDYLVDEYKTYDKYLAYQDAQILESEAKLFVADSSLNSGKPDMTFVRDGSRNQTHGSLSVVLFIAVFAILVGGCAVSSEFQNGTVRLLMIRPRTRAKVLFSKYLAGLLLAYALFFIIYIVTIVTNGFMYGFADYMYPNYTASGDINFFAMFFKELVIVSFSMIFLYSFAFALSTIIRNSAVSIIIPTLGILGSFILMQAMYQFANMNWMSFTPVLYIPMYDFYGDYSALDQLVDKGMTLSPMLGVLVLSIYSAISMGLAALIFKKTDITN